MVNITTTQKQRDKMVQMAVDGYSADKICAKFKWVKRYTVLDAVRKAGVKFAPIIHYCRKCGKLIEDDTTKNHTKVLCSPVCVQISENKTHKKWRKAHYVKKGYSGQLGENRAKSYPMWKCENDCGYTVEMGFDPRKSHTNNKIKALKCPNCEHEKTAT